MTAPPGVAARSASLNLLISLRPGQWVKNVFVFGALVFGHRLGDPRDVGTTVAAFLVLCGLSGAVYLVNDVFDREQDRRHPLKALRPIASGALQSRTALEAATTLGILSLLVAFGLGPGFLAITSAYLALLLAYSAILKHLVILDVLTIAAGFALRAFAGGVVIAVPVSHSLLVCTSLLALFLALSKRRHELVLLANSATGHRPILEEYTPYLLDQLIAVVTASTLVTYIFYAVSPDTAQRFGTSLLGLTIPFPLYGIFRYLYLVHLREKGGSPTALLFGDRPLLLCVAFWAITVILIIYRPFGVGGPGGLALPQ